MPRPATAPGRRHGAGPDKKVKARRASYDVAFKTHVVRTALERPPNNRIKPTCALFPGIEPCQAEDGHSLNPSLPNPNPNPNRLT